MISANGNSVAPQLKCNSAIEANRSFGMPNHEFKPRSGRKVAWVVYPPNLMQSSPEARLD